MRRFAAKPVAAAARYKVVRSIAVLSMLAATLLLIMSNRAFSFDKLSDRIEKALGLLVDEFPDPERSNPRAHVCEQSAGHHLEFVCGAGLRCSSLFATLNDARIFYIEHISRPNMSGCDEKSFVDEVTEVVRYFFDVDAGIAIQISDNMHRTAFKTASGERNPELINKKQAKPIKFNNGIGYLSINYESYPAEYVKRYRFRWDNVSR